MATLTKKDLLEAIEDMPMDAEVYIDIGDDYECEWVAPEIVCNIEDNTISLC